MDPSRDPPRIALLVLSVLVGLGWSSAQAQPAPEATAEPRVRADEGTAPELPPALPEESAPPSAPPEVPAPPEERTPSSWRAAEIPPATVPGAGPSLRLADAIARSLANVQVVQANVNVQTATVARFEALKEFIPLVELPQLMVGFRRFTGPGTILLFPDVTDGVPLVGRPRLDRASLNRVNLLLPLDPSGQITALPVAEEGIRSRLLMEQLVRRSQVALAIQDYFEAKQVQYGIRTARLGVTLAQETLALTERKLRQRQVHEVEVSQARVDESKARVLLADLEKTSRIAQLRLGEVLHQSRLLVPQGPAPLPIELDHAYCFDLDDPDFVDLGVVPDFPCSRAEAIQLAKRQRLEVRIRVVGLRIARLQQKRDWIRLFGIGTLPAELGFKSTSQGNGGVTLGAIFGATYNLPVENIELWANLRRARLDVVASQLELEAALVEVAADAGISWDRWQQAIIDWEQREAELRLQREYLERLERLFREKQAIRLDVLGAQVNVLQADANRWTAWFNLQLARLDVLRSTEQLLDYVEKAGIADLSAGRRVPPPGYWSRKRQWPWLPWLVRNQSSEPPNQEVNHGGREEQSLLAGGLHSVGGAAAGMGPSRLATTADSRADTDSDLTRAGASRTARDGSAPTRRGGDVADPSGDTGRRVQSRRTAAQRPRSDPAGRPLPRRDHRSADHPAPPRGGDRRARGTAPSGPPSRPPDLTDDPVR